MKAARGSCCSQLKHTFGVSLSTLFAIVFGVWLLDDQLTPRIVAGGLLTLTGVTVIAMRNARQATPSSLRVPK